MTSHLDACRVIALGIALCCSPRSLLRRLVESEQSYGLLVRSMHRWPLQHRAGLNHLRSVCRRHLFDRGRSHFFRPLWPVRLRQHLRPRSIVLHAMRGGQDFTIRHLLCGLSLRHDIRHWRVHVLSLPPWLLGHRWPLHAVRARPLCPSRSVVELLGLSCGHLPSVARCIRRSLLSGVLGGQSVGRWQRLLHAVLCWNLHTGDAAILCPVSCRKRVGHGQLHLHELQRGEIQLQ